MHIPRFWQKADLDGVLAWGWSDFSPEDAMSHAGRRAQRIREWLDRGGPEPAMDPDMPYGYPDRPLREEVLREFRDAQGRTIAAVSQNRLGCLVLNTTNLMFADVDSSVDPDAQAGGFLSRLLGRKKEKPPQSQFDGHMAVLASEWLKKEAGWGLRVYRTRAGARIMATHAPVAHDDAAVERVFFAFNADPLYRNLCAKQQCFRARLTPKPWRCKVRKPPAHWPWENEKAEAGYREWEQCYTEAARNFATCRLLGQFGAEEIHPALRELVEFHDESTRAASGMPLA
jgi:hypothetical protein